MKLGVAKKIILLFTPVLVLSLLTLGLYFVTQQKRILTQSFTQRMNLIMDEMAWDIQALENPNHDQLQKMINQFITQYHLLSCLVLDRDGRIIVQAGSASSDADIAYYHRTIRLLNKTQTSSTDTNNNNLPLEKQISLTVSSKDLSTSIHHIEKKMSVAVLACICFALLFFVLTVWTVLAQPLHRLLRGLDTIIHQGDLCHRIYMKHQDEFGQLADAFNEMTDELKKIVVRDRDLETVVDYEHKRAVVLGRANKDLDHINQELRDFAQIVSHDLKAPLRGIRSLTEWIIQDYRDKFDEQGRDQMALLSSRVGRMENLINGILEYSQAGHHREGIEDVDLNTVINEIVDDISPPKHIHISIKNKLPVLQIHKTKIIQVFMNLISNAVKYNDKPVGIVSVDCYDKGDQWQFSVADNGAGIEEKHYDTIFKMFQTLSPKDDCESTGVGLAVVKRIIDGWNGRIWVRSRVGEGTMFVFTLAKQFKRTNNEKHQASTTC